MAIESVNYSDSANISILNISNNVKEVYQFNEICLISEVNF